MGLSCLRPLPSVLLFISSIALACVAAAEPAPGEWTVLRFSGEVSIEPPDAVPGGALSAGARLEPPFAARTRDGELTLERGEDRLTLGPGSHIDVPASEPSADGAATRIRQSLGSVLYQVQKRARALFEVETRYLVSVVKGTTFNILAAADATTVSLIEGRLLVHTPEPGAEVILEAGQAAYRSAGDETITVQDQRNVSAPVRGPVRIGRNHRTDLAAQGPASLPVERHALAGPPPAEAVMPVGVENETVPLEAIERTLAGGDAGLVLGDVSLAGGSGLELALGDSSIALGGAQLGLGGAQLELGGTRLELGGIEADIDLDPGIALGDTSIAIGDLAIEGTALTPDIALGGIALDLGETRIDLDSGLDLGDVSVGIGGVNVGETALTPGLGLGETTLGITDTVVSIETGLDLGIIEPIEVALEVDGGDVGATIGGVVDTLTDTTSTVLDPLLGRLGLF